MNYYRRYVGDYLRDTADLSMAEHGAYTLLLDYYYADERPIPKEKRTIYRMLRALDAAEQRAVDVVLEKFFTLTDEGYRNARADKEIGVSQQARNNGKKGGRPITGDETGGQTGAGTGVITGKGTGSKTGDETGEGGGLVHPPTTNHQPPTTSLHPSKKARAPSGDDSPEEQAATMRGAMAKALRDEGVTVTPSHPQLVAWHKAGVSIQILREAVDIARQRKPKPAPIAAAYLAPIVDELLKQPPEVAKAKVGDWWTTAAGITSKAAEIDIRVDRNPDEPDGVHHTRLRCAIAAKIGMGPWIDPRNATEMRIYDQFLGGMNS